MTTLTNSEHATLGRAKTSKSGVVFTGLIASTLPVLIGVMMLLSLAGERPLLARRSKVWWNPIARRLDTASPTVVRRLTTWWGVALVAIGALQVVAQLVGLSITNPVDIFVRSIGALAVEMAVAVTTRRYLLRDRGRLHKSNDTE